MKHTCILYIIIAIAISSCGSDSRGGRPASVEGALLFECIEVDNRTLVHRFSNTTDRPVMLDKGYFMTLSGGVEENNKRTRRVLGHIVGSHCIGYADIALIRPGWYVDIKAKLGEGTSDFIKWYKAEASENWYINADVEVRVWACGRPIMNMEDIKGVKPTKLSASVIMAK